VHVDDSGCCSGSERKRESERERDNKSNQTTRMFTRTRCAKYLRSIAKSEAYYLVDIYIYIYIPHSDTPHTHHTTHICTCYEYLKFTSSFVRERKTEREREREKERERERER